jgi:hypothetical protein
MSNIYRALCAEHLPELRGMFERILCVARNPHKRAIGNIELAGQLIDAVVSWSESSLAQLGPVADLAAWLIADSRPMDPEVAALTTEALWDLYTGSSTPQPEPVAQPEPEEVAPIVVPSPAGSLVERLVGIIGLDPVGDGKARAVILAVADALIDWWDSDEVARTGWEAAKWLEQETKR